MAPLHRIIIDTDPGVDDTLAMLLALAASPEEIEVLLLSVTFGNVEVQSCLKNVVALFHVVEKELEWRRARGQLEGFDTMKTFKPLVAVGADHPLEEELLKADYFHGRDGLGGVHTSHPHLSPSDAWKTLFHPASAIGSSPKDIKPQELASVETSFRPSIVPAHQEILRILRENEPDTITIVAVGPLTNLALAASEDTETFLKVKEVVVMGGAVEVEGNITPVAEFNTYADAVATARVFALTSSKPSSTMPEPPPTGSLLPGLPAYATNLSRPLKLTLMPLDITTPHLLTKSLFDAKVAPLVKAGSPLAEWVSVFMGKTFEKISSMTGNFDDPGLSLHDPLCIWYMLSRSSPAWMGAPKGLEDIRVETSGQWTRGMHVVDRRHRRKTPSSAQVMSPGAVDISNPMDSLTIGSHEAGTEPDADEDSWHSEKQGNRINRIVSSPGEEAFGKYLLERIFG